MRLIKVSKIITVILLIQFFTSVGCQQSNTAVISETDAKMLGDLYCEARNKVDLSILDKVYSPDVIVYDCSLPKAIVGLDALKSYYAGNHKAIPDFHMVLEDMIVKGDKIIWIWHVSGTNTGSFGELPPTNKPLDFSGVAIDRVADGKVVEEWVYFNQMDVFDQLGFSLVPPSNN